MARWIKSILIPLWILIPLFSLQATPAVVRIAALRGPTGLGMVRLIRENTQLSPTIRTEYLTFPSPDVLIPRLINREIEIAALPTNVAANLYNRGVPYVLAAIIGNGMLYAISTDPGVVDLRSLHRIQNIGKGATPEFVFKHILQARGLEGHVQVEFRFAPMELAQLLIAGRETTGILPEPFATRVLRARTDARIISDLQVEWASIYPDTPTYPMTALVVRSDFLAANRDLVNAFLALYSNSQAWVRENTGEAGTLANQLNFGIDSEDAKEAIPRTNLTFVPAGKARPVVERFLTILLQTSPESIGGRLPDSGFYAIP